MSKVHVGPNGPGKCEATVGKCRYGGESGQENHYDTMEQAEAAFAEKMEAEHGSATQPKRKANPQRHLEEANLIHEKTKRSLAKIGKDVDTLAESYPAFREAIAASKTLENLDDYPNAEDRREARFRNQAKISNLELQAAFTIAVEAANNKNGKTLQESFKIREAHNDLVDKSTAEMEKLHRAKEGSDHSPAALREVRDNSRKIFAQAQAIMRQSSQTGTESHYKNGKRRIGAMSLSELNDRQKDQTERVELLTKRWKKAGGEKRLKLKAELQAATKKQVATANRIERMQKAAQAAKRREARLKLS